MLGTEGDKNHNGSHRAQIMVAALNLATLIGLLGGLSYFFSEYFMGGGSHIIESSYRDSFAGKSDQIDINEARWSTILLFLLFCLHQIRLWFGLNFILFDSSYRAAGRAKAAQLKSIDVKLEILLFVVLYLLLGASMTAVAKGLSGATVAYILFAQAVVMITYTAMVWEQFVVLDQDRIANRIVVVADTVHVLFMVSYFLVVIFPAPTKAVFSFMYVPSPSWVMNELAIALVFLFMAEFWAVYWESLGRVFVLIRESFSG